MVTTEMSAVREERETMQGTVSDGARRLTASPTIYLTNCHHLASHVTLTTLIADR